jgi:hypothetical protein
MRERKGLYRRIDHSKVSKQLLSRERYEPVVAALAKQVSSAVKFPIAVVDATSASAQSITRPYSLSSRGGARSSKSLIDVTASPKPRALPADGSLSVAFVRCHFAEIRR